MSEKREFVYKVIDGERIYQEHLLANGQHKKFQGTVGEFLVLLDHYVQKAMRIWPDTAGDQPTLHQIRKIAALAVQCMEINGAEARVTPRLGYKVGEITVNQAELENIYNGNANQGQRPAEPPAYESGTYEPSVGHVQPQQQMQSCTEAARKTANARTIINTMGRSRLVIDDKYPDDIDMHFIAVAGQVQQWLDEAYHAGCRSVANTRDASLRQKI